MVSYIGYLKGYEWLSDAANDSSIAEIALQAGMESSATLVSAYGFAAVEQESRTRKLMSLGIEKISEQEYPWSYRTQCEGSSEDIERIREITWANSSM